MVCFTATRTPKNAIIYYNIIHSTTTVLDSEEWLALRPPRGLYEADTLLFLACPLPPSGSQME